MKIILYFVTTIKVIVNHMNIIIIQILENVLSLIVEMVTFSLILNAINFALKIFHYQLMIINVKVSLTIVI